MTNLQYLGLAYRKAKVDLYYSSHASLDAIASYEENLHSNLSALQDKRFPLRDLAAPYMEYLSRETGDSTFLVIRSGSDSLCIERKLGGYPVKVFTVEPGHRHPMGIGAGGLAMLSFLSEAEQEQMIQLIEPRLSMYPGLTPQGLREGIVQTRERGWAQAADVAVSGVTGIGVPLLDGKGQPFSAVSVGAVSVRMTKEKISHAAALLTEQSRKLAQALLEGHSTGDASRGVR